MFVVQEHGTCPSNGEADTKDGNSDRKSTIRASREPTRAQELIWDPFFRPYSSLHFGDSQDLRNLFGLLDTSGDGSVSWDELASIQDNPELRTWMQALDLDVYDLKGLFKMLDVDGNQSITLDELIESAPRIKGPAKSVDVLSVLAQIRKINEKVCTLRTDVHILSAPGRPVQPKPLVPNSEHAEPGFEMVASLDSAEVSVLVSEPGVGNWGDRYAL